MDKDKIIELAACNESDLYSERRCSFDQETLIAFAHSVIDAERQRLQPAIEALQSCSDAMDYMSEYDIPIGLPLRVSEALRLAKGEA